MNCWEVTTKRGFLMAENPVNCVSSVLNGELKIAVEAIENIANSLPHHIDNETTREVCHNLPVLKVYSLGTLELAHRERLHQIYAYLTNAYLWAPGEVPVNSLPAQLAVPFVQLSDLVNRPPTLSYTNTQLCNWQVIDPAKPLDDAENLKTLQTFQNYPDEEWFWVIHIAIEAAGGAAVMAGKDAVMAAKVGDVDRLTKGLRIITDGLSKIIALAKRIEEGCDPDIYFKTLRPFLFNKEEGLIFEGVKRYEGKPQKFYGQTGAQSSLIPALCEVLGIKHQKSDLTLYLDNVRQYMPKPHRNFLSSLGANSVRTLAAATPTLKNKYNDCARLILEFRRFHLQLAAKYIATKVKNEKGSGGTEFMKWLKLMTLETEQQLL
ncbi:MAG: hypothetical protein JKY67_22965 [Pseudomonadales bacterium]|nr:hypothetical protein [Pseudomonadales bacterium]